MGPTGPQHGLPVDDGNFGTDMPQTQPPQADVTVERHMARFSKTKEFQKLKDVILSRVDYYKQYAPGSANPIAYRDLPNDERGWRTLVADVVIEEFTSLISAYEMAGEIVKDADSKK